MERKWLELKGSRVGQARGGVVDDLGEERTSGCENVRVWRQRGDTKRFLHPNVFQVQSTCIDMRGNAVAEEKGEVEVGQE